MIPPPPEVARPKLETEEYAGFRLHVVKLLLHVVKLLLHVVKLLLHVVKLLLHVVCASGCLSVFLLQLFLPLRATS
jgi:hypothetical protein